MNADLLGWLRKFNRKERFFVVQQSTKNGFEPNSDFVKKLAKLIGIEESIPDDAGRVFIAMDYHFDWLYASLFLADKASDGSPVENDKKIIKANQEDVDLLLAFQDARNSDKTHLIMIEAKGESAWKNDQASSKGDRLQEIFGDPNKWEGVEPHYVIWSPNKPWNLETDNFPKWALNENGGFYFLELKMNEEMFKVTRCDENGAEKKDGNYWKVEKT
jgi:hypothetical protein